MPTYWMVAARLLYDEPSSSPKPCKKKPSSSLVEKGSNYKALQQVANRKKRTY